jgi:tRNA A-37 threonylcarbamoyl transferase component Bud32
MSTQDRAPIPPEDVATLDRLEPADRTRLAELLDGYMAEILAGREPDRRRLLAENPDLAAELEPCLAGIEFIQKTAAPDPEQPARLGEFLILKEIGRGGMGVVYEAEQTTLKRKVALKVLRFGVVADQGAMDRFRREAETVARLHHTHIVPIFAVGSHDGVSFDAMQFIDGSSLADVLNESRAQSVPLDPATLARWGLEAAEALAHAHQRGVVHRDVKPSNLLIDREGLLWLTDFGLAKREDEATLTISGTLMGTPRYMSPEQADPSKSAVDHRSDIYSLGATLYELATGRPVFDSSTPHGLLLKILRDDAIPPRAIRAETPRDLETIIQTCLNKQPEARYPKAQDLADDLRAYLQGRPIRARRASPVERAVRFARRHGKGAKISGLAALAATIIVVGSIVGWNAYGNWRLGRLVLSTAGPPLTARLVDDRGTNIGEEFSIGTKTVVPLAAGEYRMKTSAQGLFSETFRMYVERGVSRPLTVRLGEGQLWTRSPIPFTSAARAIAFDGNRCDMVASYGRTLRRFDGTTGIQVWESNPPKLPSNSVFSDQLGTDCVYPFSDVDGDGTRDLICGDGNARGWRCVSGKDGSNLWFRELGKPDADPIPLDDLDGDGLADCLAWIDDGHAGHQVEAVSSRTGKALWTSPTVPFRSYRPSLPPAVVRIANEWRVQVVDESRWIELDVKTGTQKGTAFTLPGEPRRAPQFADLDGDGEAEMLLLTPGKVYDESLLTVFSIAGRQPLWNATVRAMFTEVTDRTGVRSTWPLVVDLDPKRPGMDVILPDSNTLPPSFRYRGIQALEGRSGKRLWSVPIKRRQIGDTPVEPIVSGPDLDGDGVPEVFSATITPSENLTPGEAFASPNDSPRLYLDAISGRAGRRLWWWDEVIESKERRIDGLRWGKVGPDDAAFLAVTLVTTDQILPTQGQIPPEQPPGSTYLIDVRDGKTLRSSSSFRLLGMGDFDGDGASDPWGSAVEGLRAFPTPPTEAWRALGTFVGGADYDGDGQEDVVSADSMGDGFSALGTNSKDATILARSGVDGALIWSADLTRKQSSFGDPQWTGYHLVPLHETAGDLDGDGTPDLLATLASTLTVSRQADLNVPLQAHSGKSGERLWRAGSVPGSGEGIGNTTPLGAVARDLDGDGKADPIVLHSTLLWDTSLPTGRSVRQTRLTRVSGENGRIVWDQVLVKETVFGLVSDYGFPHEFSDLDGDGVADIVVAVRKGDNAHSTAYEIAAVSAKSGAILWNHPVREQSGFPKFVVGDLDGDKVREVVVADRAPGPAVDGKRIEIAALNGRTGERRWRWLGGDEFDANQAHDLRMVRADFDGDGRAAICLNIGFPGGRQIARLDAAGNVSQLRRANEQWSHGLNACDVDGDGRDELIFHLDGAVRVVKGELNCDSWSCPTEQAVKTVLAEISGATGDGHHHRRHGDQRPDGQALLASARRTRVSHDGGAARGPKRLGRKSFSGRGDRLSSAVPAQ